MRKVVREYEVYSYEELGEEAKERARQTISEAIVEQNFDYLDEDLLTILSEDYDLKEDNIKLHYSISYCQGDGLSFDCKDLLESKYFKNKMYEGLTVNEKISLSKMINKGELSLFTKRSGCHLYQYALHSDVQALTNFYHWGKNKEELVEKIIKKLGRVYMEICDRLEKIGYECYNVEECDIEEYIDAYDIEFDKAGYVFN